MSAEFAYFEEQPGSGTRYGNNKIEYIFKGRAGYGLTYLEQLRQMASSDELFRGMYVDFRNCKLSPDGPYEVLSIAVDAVPGRTASTPKADGETVWEFNNPYESRPLEMTDGYRANWNYDLYWACEATKEAMENPAITSSPAWWLTATDTNLTAAQQLTYRWSQSQPSDMTIKADGVQKTYRWLLLVKRTRPGREGYPTAMPSVTEKIYYRSYERAVANIREGNTHVAPSKTGPLPSDPKYWVMQPDGIKEENGYYVVVNRYLYAKKWDDYYDA